MSSWFQDASKGDDEDAFATVKMKTFGVDYRNGVLVNLGDPPARIRPVKAKPKVPAEHSQKAAEFLATAISEVEPLIPKLEIFHKIQPPSKPAGKQAEDLVSQLKNVHDLLILNSLSVSQLHSTELRDYPDIATVVQHILETGQVPVSSVFECHIFADRKAQETADYIHKINLELNIARKKARDAEKSKQAELERKRKQFEEELGLSLGPLPRRTG